MVRTLATMIGVGVTVGALSGVAPSGASTPPAPGQIAPNQIFAGLVNGKFSDAIVKVACPLPIRPGETGRALRGQSLEVVAPPVIAQQFGDTGAKGTSVVAQVSPPSSVTSGVRFTRYGVKKEFPTTVPVPCSGTGVVSFTPLPGSRTARTATATVTYANITTG